VTTVRIFDHVAAPFAGVPEIVGHLLMVDPAPPPTHLPTRGDRTATAAGMRPALWRYLRVLGADAATADDLVQEAFVVMLQREQFDGSVPGAVFTFLRSTARHLWLRSRQRRSSEREVEEADAVWTARCGEGPGDEYVDALRACMAQLPERSRALLAATYGDGAGRAEAGERVGIGRDGVKSALRRLRTFLHDCITRRLARTR
jgi:RNA polymerase sigma-70 factor (ECF subfamily)